MYIHIYIVCVCVSVYGVGVYAVLWHALASNHSSERILTSAYVSIRLLCQSLETHMRSLITFDPFVLSAWLILGGLSV